MNKLKLASLVIVATVVAVLVAAINRSGTLSVQQIKGASHTAPRLTRAATDYQDTEDGVSIPTVGQSAASALNGSQHVDTSVPDSDALFDIAHALFGSGGNFAFVEVRLPEAWNIDRNQSSMFIQVTDFDSLTRERGAFAQLEFSYGTAVEFAPVTGDAMGTTPVVINGTVVAVDLYESEAAGSLYVEAIVPLQSAALRIRAITQEGGEPAIADGYRLLLLDMLGSLSITEVASSKDWIRHRVNIGDSDQIRMTLPPSWSAEQGDPNTVDVSGVGTSGDTIAIIIELLGDSSSLQEEYNSGVPLGYSILGKRAVWSESSGTIMIMPRDGRVWRIGIPAELTSRDHALVLVALSHGSVTQVYAPGTGYPAPAP